MFTYTRSASPRAADSRHRRPILPVLALVCLALAATLAVAHPAAAHPELVRAEPPEDGLLAAPPRAIELWLTERVDVGAGSPGLRVLEADGAELPVRNLRVDPNDPRHVVGEVDDVGAGTYTIIWAVRSADDGHTLSGSFAFRVGTGSAPGAATVEGERPQPWAVATRWLTFLGIAVAAAGFLYRPVLLAGAAGDRARLARRAVATTIGAFTAVLATAAEPFLQTWFPLDGAIVPTLDDALAGMPDAWWLRLCAAAMAFVLSLVLLGARRGNITPAMTAFELVGGMVALVTLVGLSFTSHAAARESYRALAIASDTVHQIAVALWVGGLAHLALSWPPGRDAAGDEPSGGDPIRRFSRYALALVVVGAGTGVLNAGLVLPAVRELWESDYGRILIAKATILVPVLALATFHRVRLHRAAVRIGSALQSTVRLEAAMVLLVVLGGSILALLSPPATATVGTVEFIDLAAPLAVEDPAHALDVRLQIAPVEPGENTVTVLLEDADGTPAPTDQVALVRLTFESLNYETEPRETDVSPNGEGGFVSDGMELSIGGWWRVQALVRRLGMPDAAATFYFMLPDPSVVGMDAVDVPSGSTAEAVALFQRGMATLTGATRVHYVQRLADGGGNYVDSDHLVDAGGANRPPAMDLRTDTFELITVGDRQWFRREGGEWTERDARPVIPPSEWDESYRGATGLRLGMTEEIDGEMARMVSFVVPARGNIDPGWFTWWIGLESGQVLRETMVARGHYMLNHFISYDEPLRIEPPVIEPAATPEATPASG
ncbi:MAG: copper resistance protein CopC [Thermomicrobiales bacterium]